MDGALTMATMRFADEVVSPDSLGDALPEAESKPQKRELDMAKQLIDSLATDFDAGRYRDEYREELLSLIERKAKGEEIVSAETEAPEPTKAPDLMAALEESLAAAKGEELAKGSGEGEAEKPKAKPRAKAGGSKAKSGGARKKPARKSKAKARS
jgi:DNA end-binding protein Ku